MIFSLLPASRRPATSGSRPTNATLCRRCRQITFVDDSMRHLHRTNEYSIGLWHRAVLAASRGASGLRVSASSRSIGREHIGHRLTLPARAQGGAIATRVPPIASVTQALPTMLPAGEQG